MKNLISLSIILSFTTESVKVISTISDIDIANAKNRIILNCFKVKIIKSELIKKIKKAALSPEIYIKTSEVIKVKERIMIKIF